MKLCLIFNNVGNITGVYDEIIYINSIDSGKQNQYNIELIAYLQNYVKRNVGDKKIIDLFKVNTNSNHWFYHRFLLRYKIEKAFYELKTIEEYQAKYSIIDVFSDNLDNSWFKNKEIQVHKNLITKNNKSKFSLFLSILKLLFISIYRFFRSSKIGFNKNQKINFLHGRNKNIRDQVITENSIIKSDIIWGFLKHKYNDTFIVIEELDLLKETKENRIVLSKKYFTKQYKKVFYSEYIYISALFNLKVIKDIISETKIINKYISTLSSITESSIDSMIASYLTKKKNASFIYSFKHNAYKNFFSKFSNKSSVLVYTENDASGKLVLDASKFYNFRTYATQHGIINEQNFAYNFSKFEQSKNLPPDKTFVWGTLIKDFLVDTSFYPINKIMVSGQIKSDVISTFKQKEVNVLSPFVFFGQPQLQENRLIETELLISAFSEYPSLNLIIKLHPKEIDDIYTKLILKYNANNIKIDLDSDIYSLINESCACITCYSTVGIEVLYFNKPLITIDVKQTDLAGYKKSKISNVVTSKRELNKTLELFFINNLFVKNEAKEYLSKTSILDGKCSERIFNEITSLKI